MQENSRDFQKSTFTKLIIILFCNFVIVFDFSEFDNKYITPKKDSYILDVPY